MDNKEELIEDLVYWIKERVGLAGAQGLVFGLSGGIDSALMAGIAKLGYPDTSLGIIMPCHSDPLDEEHGILVAKALDLNYIKVDLSQTYDTLLKSINLREDNKMVLANIKPRLRMTTLYSYAQAYNYLVAGPTNKSEFEIGYFTKHGDSGVDLLPLANIIKRDIRILAKYLNIPDIIINKQPSAGLWTNQTDEEEMGFSYDVLDNYIVTGKGRGESHLKIDRMNITSNHKREYPPIFKINK